MAADLTIFDEPHHHALEIMATRALADGDAATAFEFADRRCRIGPAPSSDCYVLRAEASYRMGEIAEAIGDLESALEILPEDLVANRRMLAWAQGPRQRAAAIAILAGERDFGVLRNALAVLCQDGRRPFAAVTVLDDTIQGWTTWSGHGIVELTIASPDGSFSVALKPDRRHPLAGRDAHAAAINVARPRSRHPQSISLATRTEVFHSTRAPPNEAVAKTPPRPGAQAGEQRTTVIVPVYDDYAATKACLASLIKALPPGGSVRILIVDDASPDPRIRRHLASLGRHRFLEVLTNPTNLGFVGAVNRALGRTEGDVVLLNSDTIVPPGFLERLAAAAYASSDIGTVTPVSNNGDFMSFPVANRVNPPGSTEDIHATDRIAADVNGGRIIDVPNGIGFCMYVTRRCLDRTGGLSERYHRGYLEDVDLCLRAREFGLRSVCAADVFVGHAGSRSFRNEKQSLVSRNFKVLEKSFPHYSRECRAFMDADPLRPARAAIERAMPRRPGTVVLVTGGGVVAAVARAQVAGLNADNTQVLICHIGHRPEGLAATLSDPAGNAPQSIEFDLSDEAGRAALLEFIRQSDPSRIELIDPAGIPDLLANGLCGLGVPYDILIADAGLLDPGRISTPASLAMRLRPGELPFATPDESKVLRRSHREQSWRRIADGAARILAPCSQAEGFARRFLSAQNMEKLARTVRSPLPARRRLPKGTGRLGIVSTRTSAFEFEFVREVVRFMKGAHPQVAIAVLGTTLDDLALMRFGNVFVSGSIEPDDVEHLVRQYRLSTVVAGIGPPLFGHPAIEAAQHCGLPAAYFDWSLGHCKPRGRDLAIDPSVPPRLTAGVLGRWVTGR